jgi:TRAP-type C4-dicarboxylate transport system substrate-binding protein
MVPVSCSHGARSGINDLQGLKIRTGGGVAESVARALGGAGFARSSTDSYELLRSGAADGIFFPLESVVTFKIVTVLEQATLFPSDLYNSAFALFMNEDKWNALARQDQEAIDTIAREHIARLAGRSWDEADRQGLDVLRKAGVKIVHADPGFAAEVRRRSRPIVDD